MASVTYHAHTGLTVDGNVCKLYVTRPLDKDGGTGMECMYRVKLGHTCHNLRAAFGMHHTLMTKGDMRLTDWSEFA